MAVDFKSLGKFEQGALVAGGLSIILSFFSRYVSADLGPLGTYGISAWHSYAVLGMLLIVASVAVVAVKAFSKESLPDGIPWSLVAVATAGFGTILIVLRGLTAGDGAGVGWSGWLLFITSIALTAFTYLLFKESGEKLPDLNKKDTPPAPPAPPAA
jgi:hypothetical protein